MLEGETSNGRLRDIQLNQAVLELTLPMHHFIIIIIFTVALDAPGGVLVGIAASGRLAFS